MGVKKIMDTFFASMQEQTMAGYGGKLVNTPMGPFRWNDTMQLWENVNNGMVMNNISFQDSIMMLDYASYDGGGISTVSGGDPSLILYLNFAANSIGSMTYARGGTASFIDSNRQIDFANPNTPRFSYYPTGTTVGLLIENSSTNLLLRGECFSSSWQASPTIDDDGDPFTLPVPTIALSSGTLYGNDPQGTKFATILMPRGNCAEARHYINTTYSITPVAGSTYTASVWIKGFGTTFNRYFGIVADNNQARAYFDIQTQTSTSVNTGNVFGPAYSKLTAYDNNWYRAEMVWGATSGIFSIWLVPLTTYTDPVQTYAASDANTSGMLIWGAQLEQNTSASSYIRTTGSTATRGNDFAYFSGTGFTSWFGASQGTFLIEFDRKERGHTADNVKVKTVMATNWNQGTCAGFALDYSSTVPTPSLRFRDSTPSTFTLITNGVLPGINKVAFSYNLTGSTYNISANLNGLCTGTGSVASSRINLAGASYMTFGYKETELGATAFDYLNTLIRSVKYWNVVKTPAELQQLSS
jgi:hypothetical protein